MNDYCLNGAIRRLQQIGMTGDLHGWYFEKIVSE